MIDRPTQELVRCTKVNEAVQKAYADLVGEVFLRIRNNQYTDREFLFDLGDALHNVQGVLVDYGNWINDEEYRELYLRPFDRKWAEETFSLEEVLEQKIQAHTSENQSI